MSFTCCIVAWGLSRVGRGRKTVLTCFTCSSHKRCDVRADVMRTGHWYGEGDGGGVAWIRPTRLLPSEALPKDGCPLLLFFVYWGFSQTDDKRTGHQSQKNLPLALPPSQRGNQEGGGHWQDTCSNKQSAWVFFLKKSLLKAQKTWKCHVSVNSSNLWWDCWLQTDGRDKPRPPGTTTSGEGLCANSVVSGHGRAPAIKPIKNWIPTRVPSFTSVCFVCCAVVNTSSACSMPPPLPKPYRCRLRSRL